MRKFLSILMLACLLALGMALPAAAEEGSPAQLYVRVGDDYVTELTVPVDVSRSVSFFTKEGEVYTPVVAVPVVSDGSVIELNGEVNTFTIRGLTTGTSSLQLKEGDTALSTVVQVAVPASHLEISTDNGANWNTSVDSLKIGEYPVQFRLGADGIYTECSAGDITVDKQGLTIGGGKLTASTTGTYILSYHSYTVSVSVIADSATISTDELSHLHDSSADFVSFLRTKKGYSGSGDFTLRLPEGDLGDIICSTRLSGNAKLTLQGVASLKTNVKGKLTISAPNVCLDGIKFTGTADATGAVGPSVIVDPGCDLTVSNCSFTSSDYVFRLKQDDDGKVSKLTLTANTFGSGNRMATIVDPTGAEVGKWTAKQQGNDSSTVVIDFGVTVVKEKTGDKTDALHINVLASKATQINKGWSISFLTDCDFKDAYVVYSRKKTTSILENGGILIAGQNKGEYIVVNDSYPKLTKKSNYYELKVTQNHIKYLAEVTLEKFPYAAASITLSGNTVETTMKTTSEGRTLTIPKLQAGTYTIKETTKTITKTTTKTTTTSRTYTTSNQDYFLITPAGFSNAVRYVKDNLVTLNCTAAGTKPISLPVASMAAAAEKGYSVLVKTKGAEMTLDAAALKSLAQQAKGSTVLLHYKSLNHKTLTDVGQASVEGHLTRHPNDCADLAFLVTATSESETIEDLQKGTVTLKIPFIILPGTEDAENVVYALQGEDLTEARDTAVADGHLTTKLLDLTEHMVFQVGEPVETETTEATEETIEETTEETTEETWYEEDDFGEEDAGGFPIWIPIAAVVLLAGGGAAVWFLRKRLKK